MVPGPPGCKYMSTPCGAPNAANASTSAVLGASSTRSTSALALSPTAASICGSRSLMLVPAIRSASGPSSASSGGISTGQRAMSVIYGAERSRKPTSTRSLPGTYFTPSRARRR